MNVFTINNSVQTIAIAISAHVYNNLTGVGNVGGIIGTSYHYFFSELSSEQVPNIIQVPQFRDHSFS